MEENKVVATQDQDYSFNDQWTKPNIKIGRLTIIVAIICSFLPNIYLYIVHGAAPGFSVAMAAWAAIASAYAAFWIVEPISYGTVFGTTGTYISVLTGSMAQMRLPASATAQDATGVEADSPQADVISVLGICGSVIVNVVAVTLFVVAGSFIVSILPEGVKVAITTLVLPSLFGALYVQFAMRKWQVALIALPLALLTRLYIPLPAWAFILVAIFGTLAISLVLQKAKVIK